MERETLRRLELLNQLALTTDEKEAALAFFAEHEKGRAICDLLDTESTERMVHVQPINTVVRPEVAKKPYSRDELQAGAPDAGEGFWRVPRVLE